MEYFYRWKMSPEYQVWKAGRLPRQIEEQFVPDFHADNCHVSQPLSSYRPLSSAGRRPPHCVDSGKSVAERGVGMEPVSSEQGSRTSTGSWT